MERIAHIELVEMRRMKRDCMDRERERVETERMGMGVTGSMAVVGMPTRSARPRTEVKSTA